ncbi:hypothetical protein GGF43_003390 [Coemansia sp. RSA 2618]|nr:hypothetical protein GGF43_003390 [Coemansia sp. RSA 2618]
MSPRDPEFGCMQQLLEHALAGRNSRAAVKLAQRIVDLRTRNRRIASAMTDEWVRAVLRGALELDVVPAAGQKQQQHPFVGIALALFQIDVLSRGVLSDLNDSRVLRCANELLSGNPVPGANEIAAELGEAAAGILQSVEGSNKRRSKSGDRVDRLNKTLQLPGNLPGSSLKQAASASFPEPFKAGASYTQMKNWYTDVYECGQVPRLPQILKMLGQALKQRDHKFWEAVVYDHLPELLERLDNVVPDEKRERVAAQYRQEIWSSAIRAHALLNEIEEAAECFGRVVAAGSYPASEACAALLDALTDQNTPLPKLPSDADLPTTALYGMEPAHPPQGESPQDRFIVAESPTHRRALVAKTGLAMLYASLHHGMWPSVYFYSVLFAALVRARMSRELQHVFEVVMPASMRRVPVRLRSLRGFMPSPFSWLMAIRGAKECGDSALTDRWFSEYRMSAMPIFREESSAYIRLESKRFSKHSLLAQLALPYYAVSRIPRPRTDSKAVPTPWYDLQQVEQQLEIDRLRALDKLPIPFTGAAQMLTIFARVDEHRDMERCEELAEEIAALFADTQAPHYVRPVSYVELAGCWKSMVFGYIAVLKQMQLELACGIVEQSSVNGLQERLVFWYRKWAAAYKRVSLSENESPGQEIRLSSAHKEFAEDICRRLNVPVEESI